MFRTVFFAVGLCAALLCASTSVEAQGWVISGTVVGEGGAPLAGVDIDLFMGGTEITDLTQDFTGPDGTFSFTILVAVPIGTYSLLFLPGVDSPHFSKTIQVGLGGSTSVGTVMLDPGRFVSGVVVDELGIGLPEVDIDGFDAVGDPVALNLDFTDTDGTFQVLFPVGVFDLEFKPTLGTLGGPYVPIALDQVDLTSSVNLGNIVLRDGYTVSGTVHNSLGAGVFNVDIDITEIATGERIFTPNDDTGPTGAFSVIAPAGAMLVNAAPVAGVPLTTVELTVDVVVPGGASTGIIVLEDAVPVSGRAVSGTGTPIPMVDLDFIAAGLDVPTSSDDSDAAGLFSVMVAPNTYDIVLRPPFASGFAPKLLANTVISGATALGDVVLENGIVISGSVTNGVAPVALAEISMVDTATQQFVPVFGGRTDTGGAYAFRQVTGTFDITATPPVGSGLSPLTQTGVVIIGNTTVNFDLGGGTGPTTFVRGDANGDSTVNLADAVKILEVLFSGGTPIPCQDTQDANDDGGVDVSDPIYLLTYLFTSGPAPSAPFPTAGIDPTPDGLACP
ncbi:MAG: hypothetical protein KDC38_16630 [Planctomycetes bacterium]|nr:hypothetical protein [Planctomycetota bacterium]